MALFNVESGIPDLDGTCVITDGELTSYTSFVLGAATIENLGGPGLDVRVTFPGSGLVFTIKAQEQASGNYEGRADKEAWAATLATGQPAAAAKGR